MAYNRTYRKKVKPEKYMYSRAMRKNPIISEKILWEELRKKKLGVGFRRQHIILGWIVDFYCPEIRLVIEVDGEYHNNKKSYDSHRDYTIESLGIEIIRIKNEEVLNNLQGVLNTLKEVIESKIEEKRNMW